ncbi:MAG: hypothetical protein QW171_04240 [Candidatus Bilamarchaeaceae archaeon]
MRRKKRGRMNNVIRLDYTEKDYRVYKIENTEIPENTFIICSEASRDILYNPHIAGKKLQEKMEKLSRIFVEVATKKGLRGARFEDVVEFVLLAGGLYYNIASGFKSVHGYALPQCFLGIKRQRIEGSEGEFRAVSTYENFESLPKNARVIIGDTIATGATIVRAISDLERAAAERDERIEQLIICSLACSSDGAKRIKRMEDRMKELNKDFTLYLIATEQLFHLMPDGTDLRFLKEKSIMPEETKEYTIKKYGERLGREMKCAIFDWGTRCKNPKKHYKEFMEFAEQILKSNILDKKGIREIERMKSEIAQEMEIFNRIIQCQ